MKRVVAAAAFHKADLPAAVFAGNSGPRRLVVVTCGGPIHHRPGRGWTYDDNVVSTAVPGALPPPAKAPKPAEASASE